MKKLIGELFTINPALQIRLHHVSLVVLHDPTLLLRLPYVSLVVLHDPTPLLRLPFLLQNLHLIVATLD